MLHRMHSSFPKEGSAGLSDNLVRHNDIGSAKQARKRAWCSGFQNWPAKMGAMASDASGYVDSFNGRMRAELLDYEIFYTVQEAQILISALV